METPHGSVIIRPTSEDFYSISKLMITFAENVLNDAKDESGLIIPELSSDTRHVQRDGPGGKRNAAMPMAMSIRTLDGKMYIFNHGQMIQNGYFEYRHVSPMMVSALKLDENVTLVPILDSNDSPDGTKLVKSEHPKLETPTSETVNLLGVKYGKTLALEYSDDPSNPHAQLVLLPQHELKQIMEDMEKGKKMILKINPLVKIRTHTPSVNSEDSSNCPRKDDCLNNIALYFETSRFYYYIHVTHDDPSNPKVYLEQVEKTKSFDPHTDYVRHLQFAEQLVNKEGEDAYDGELATVGEEEEPEKDPLPDINSLTLNEGFSNDLTECPNKPTSLEIVSEPNELNSEEPKKDFFTNDSTPVQGDDSKSVTV